MQSNSNPPQSATRGNGNLSRTIAAVIGGYALTAAFTGFLAIALPLSRPEAVLSATQISFAVYAVVIIWVFSVDTAGRAWRGLLLSTAVFVVAVIVSNYVGLS